MDVDETRPVENLRIEDCEVCGKNKAKYTCPRCEVRTCCLECVKIHKKELDCDGIRDRVKFKTLKNFSNIDLLNDYRLLEETARVVSKSVKLPPRSCYHPHDGSLPLDLYRLKTVASCRGVQLHFLPPSFERHRSNTTHLDHKTQELFWKIDWVFPQAEHSRFTDERVLDASLLSAHVHKFVAPDDRSFPSLSFYQAAGHSGISLLLKAERTAPNRYYMLEATSTVRENLSGKSIIENPEIYVVLNHHIHQYSVLTEEEEEDLRRKHRRRQNIKRKNAATGPNNFFFPNISDEHSTQGKTEGNECCSGGDDPTNERETEGDGRPFRKHFKFSHRGRGRGRGNFRGRWNGRGNRGHHQSPHRGNSGPHHGNSGPHHGNSGPHRGNSGPHHGNFGSHQGNSRDVNGGLSNSLEAVRIQSQ